MSNARLTPEPTFNTEDVGPAATNDPDIYVEFADNEIHVDLGEKGETPDVYWAEGWTFSSIMTATRGNGVWHEDTIVRSIPTRYCVADIQLSRNLKRVLKRNRDLATVIRPLRMTPGKDELHALYSFFRFQNIPKPLSQCWPYIEHYPSELLELTAFDPDGRLVLLSIIEAGEESSYSTKTIWLPDAAKRSLGTFAILKAFEFAASRGYKYHYVGPTILADPLFSYKLRYPAAELYRVESNQWLRADSPEGMALLNEPFKRYKAEFDAEFNCTFIPIE